MEARWIVNRHFNIQLFDYYYSDLALVTRALVQSFPDQCHQKYRNPAIVVSREVSIIDVLTLAPKIARTATQILNTCWRNLHGALYVFCTDAPSSERIYQSASTIMMTEASPSLLPHVPPALRLQDQGSHTRRLHPQADGAPSHALSIVHKLETGFSPECS